MYACVEHTLKWKIQTKRRPQSWQVQKTRTPEVPILDQNHTLLTIRILIMEYVQLLRHFMLLTSLSWNTRLFLLTKNFAQDIPEQFFSIIVCIWPNKSNPCYYFSLKIIMLWWSYLNEFIQGLWNLAKYFFKILSLYGKHWTIVGAKGWKLSIMFHLHILNFYEDNIILS